MDFKDQIKKIAERIINLKDQIQTEEATKNAFIMPFIQALGYDVFNPVEVVPEYITDLGTKKGEKIDYAILQHGKPIILIECKDWRQNLNIHDGQLLRYFHVSQARFGILTNGIIYRFYSDLVEPNKMDEKPFLEFNITELKDNQVDEIKKFHKSQFDIDHILNTASQLKYINELQNLIQAEINSPSSDFVKYFAKQVYPSVVTAKVLEQFTVLTKNSFQQHISDVITEKLKAALISTEQTELKSELSEQSDDTVEKKEEKIVTTEEEFEAFYIVKSILRQSISADRIYFRDAQSYFSILLDDNNRKPICRLYFNSSKKYIGTFNHNKVETKIEIKSIDDIYNYGTAILETMKLYL